VYQGVSEIRRQGLALIFPNNRLPGGLFIMVALCNMAEDRNRRAKI